MSFKDDLKEMFQSETIKPTFEYVHIILALFIYGEKPSEGLGRYRLKKELLIGSGTARSLITKLKEKINFLTVLSENDKSKGHILTENGLRYLNKIKEKIPIIKKGDLSVLRDIIIESENVHTYFCLIRNVPKKITNGIAQRDAAIKVNGIGATCLIYNGKNLIFPSGAFSEKENDQEKINDNVQKYFISQINEENSKLEQNDVIIIGIGDSPERSRLTALNSALTLI